MKQSKFEEVARAFVKAFPVGSEIDREELEDWATGHGNGLAETVKLSDPNKRFSSLRRQVNDGGKSRSLPEGDRFQLVIINNVSKAMEVRAYSEHVQAIGRKAIPTSMRQPLGTLDRALKQIDNVKIEELSPDQQAELADVTQDITEYLKPVREMAHQAITGLGIKRLTRQGFSEEQAKLAISMMPELQEIHKLIGLTK